MAITGALVQWLRDNLGLIAAIQLHLSGKAGLDREHYALAGRIQRDNLGRLRPRPDQGHVTQQKIEELRQFVELGLAQ